MIMSCYEEEAGTYSFPAGEYKRVKKELMDFWDKELMANFTRAMNFYEKNANKKYDEAKHELLNSVNIETYTGMSQFLEKTKAGKIAKPKKSALAKFKANFLMKNYRYFEFGEAGLYFNDDTKTIRWQVDRNNRSVEDSKNYKMRKKFFDLLETVKWTNKTGGCTRYTNEYMEEDGPCCPAENDHYGYALIRHLKSFGYTQKEIKKNVKDGKEVKPPRPYGSTNMLPYRGWANRRY